MAKIVEYFYIITVKSGVSVHSFSGVAKISGNEQTQYDVFTLLMEAKVFPHISRTNYSVIFYYVKENN